MLSTSTYYVTITTCSCPRVLHVLAFLPLSVTMMVNELGTVAFYALSTYNPGTAQYTKCL